MKDWQSLDEHYMMSTYGRLPIAISKGEGNFIYDEQGKGYLDLFTGLAVNILGHSHPALVETLKEQGTRFMHISNKFLNPPAIELAQKLVQHSIPGKIFFTNSGAESTEAAIKLIHKWMTKGEGQGKEGFVVLKNSFHGRTLGALALTRQPSIYQDFPSTTYRDQIFEVEAENKDELQRVFTDHNPAAVIMEPVLGSGGVLALSDDYLQEVQRLCQKYGALCCMDEIQTGMGRTGTFFAYQQSGIEPDMILFAKGVGGGLPLGGMLAKDQVAQCFQPGDHGTTFAPSPVAAALGNTVIEQLFDEGLLEQANIHARRLHEKLQGMVERYSAVQEVRGKGMMLGVVLEAKAEQVQQLQQQLLEEGVLVDVTQKTIVRLLPPLTLTSRDIDLFIEKFEQGITQWIRESQD